MSDASGNDRPQAAPNRLALIGITALATGIGLVPYFLFIDALIWLPLAVVASALPASLALRRRTATATAPPAAGEWLLAGWSAVSKTSVVGIIGLMLFGLFDGGVMLFDWVVEHFGFTAHADPWTWGFRGSIWFIVLGGGVAAAQAAEALFRALYVLEAGARSRFFPLLARPTALALGALVAVVVLAAMLRFLDPHGAAFAGLLSAVLLYTSLPLRFAGREREDPGHAAAVGALDLLLRGPDYRVVPTPRTGKAEIDPLLKPVDLLVKTGERTFAVQVKSIASPEPVEWTEASALRTAALLLSQEVSNGATVEPVLIVVGGQIAQSLTAFSQRERVPIVHFERLGELVGDRQELTRRLQDIGLAARSPQPAPAA